MQWGLPRDGVLGAHLGTVSWTLVTVPSQTGLGAGEEGHRGPPSNDHGGTLGSRAGSRPQGRRVETWSSGEERDLQVLAGQQLRTPAQPPPRGLPQLLP